MNNINESKPQIVSPEYPHKQQHTLMSLWFSDKETRIGH